ncbi:MAG: U32 family peptidase [Clostridia bacterium]|nr:U32 family peptidase [Clostridia bacterium]
MNRKLELLSPAGDMACLEAALRFGADAVYVGGPRLQLRAGTAGFSMDELARAARAAHALGKRLYVAVNAFPTNREIDALGDYAQALQAAGADAAIVADLGAVATMRRCAPGLPVHISTQANCLNYAAARAYHDMGASRVVLGREMTLNEIAELRQKTPPALELEAFIHGAMCMAWSGRCMISAYLTGRSANRGACAQSCRWKYRLEEEKRPGEYFPVEEDAGGMTILSSFDLNCIDFLDRIIDAGVISFKIEGRMKTPYYVATVTNAYRRRLDGILSGDESMLPALRRELDAVSHRAYASGFYFGEMKRHAPEDGHYLQDCQFVGTVLQRLPGGRVRVELRNRFAAGANLEVLSPHTLGLTFTARNLTDPDGTPLESASVPMSLYDLDAPEAVEPGDMLRLRLDTPS